MVRQGGQALIEAVLAIALFVTLTMFVASEFKSRQVLSNLVSGPWKSLDGMIRNSHWSPREETDTYHPNLLKRHGSTLGEPAQ